MALTTDPWALTANPAVRRAHYADLLRRGHWRCSKCRSERPLSDFNLRRTGRGAGKPTRGFCNRHPLPDRTAWQYGVDYEAMLARQGGRCAICQTGTPRGKGKFHVDHDHRCCPGKRSCGKCVRGLLCAKCNSGIGYFNDDTALLERAMAYVSR